MIELEKFKLKIADIILAVDCLDRPLRLRADSPLGAFIFEGDNEPDLRLTIAHDGVPEMPVSTPIFDSGSVWKLYKHDSKYFMSLAFPGEDRPYKVGIVDEAFKTGAIFMQELDERSRNLDPLEYPLDEWLLINLLARGRGVEIHGCGVNRQTETSLFVGSSGAGKSTMANFWRDRPGVEILSDDRIIVRQNGAGYLAYGTPWHGEARFFSPSGAKLGGIYFLKQSNKNHLRRLSNIEAVSKLMVCAFPTFHSKEGLDFTVDFCSRLSQAVACRELEFTKDERVVDYLEEAGGL